MVKITIQVPVELDDQFFEDILVTMMEGGSNYWIDHMEIDTMKPKDTPRSVWAAQVINNDGTVVIFQKEENAVGIPLTKELLIAGLREWVENHPSAVTIINMNPHTIDAGDIDADGADAILQYALFGKIVYG